MRIGKIVTCLLAIVEKDAYADDYVLIQEQELLSSICGWRCFSVHVDSYQTLESSWADSARCAHCDVIVTFLTL